MYDKLIRRGVDFIFANGNAEEEKKEIYSYGLELLLMYLVNTGTILLFGLFFGRFSETLIFLAGYALLQSFAGGYHAMTHLRCLLLTFAGWVAAMLILPVIAAYWFLPCILAAVGLIVIFTFAPVKHVNFPMSTEKVRKMRKIARVNTLFLFIIVLANSFLFPEAKTFTSLLGITLFLSGVSMLFAVLKEVLQKAKAVQSPTSSYNIEKIQHGGRDSAKEKVENTGC